MTMYPKLDEKSWNRLPQIFKDIIQWDEKDPRQVKVVAMADSETYLESVSDWKYNRNNLSEGARRFITKQRGGTVA